MTYKQNRFDTLNAALESEGLEGTWILVTLVRGTVKLSDIFTMTERGMDCL